MYDRIILSGFQSGAMKSAGVFYFDKELGLSPALTKKVSDHYPVELTLFEENSGLLDLPPRIVPGGRTMKIARRPKKQ